MKKIILVLLTFVSLVACNQPKVAYVDVKELMKEYKGTKETEEAMKAKSDGLKHKLDSLVANWQQKVQIYQQGAQKMSAKARSENEQSLMQEQQSIGQLQQMYQAQLQKEGEESVKGITREIDSFVAGYAKSKGYTYILGTSEDTQTVLYAQENMDITADILAQMNKSYKSKK
ncbi:MAG: OmpH family outer membrane protein [Flavobacteriaceae bacterium]|nr:OmpH family outer membrane protein [Flavobacteriaceae bacterium]MCB0474194.1 OmpH family outer membrane protein [Flavobacteriaceae bacterium]